MFGRRNNLLAVAALLMALCPAAAEAQPALTVAEARGSLVGRWTGHLDADADNPNPLFRLPLTSEIVDGGDGATMIERQLIRGGPENGGRLVTIVSLLDRDGVTLHSTQQTGGTAPEHSTLTLSLVAARDASHWRMLGVEDYVHGGRSLQSRTTTVLDGDSLVIEFEVDPAGEEPPFGKIRWEMRRAAQ
jgi:hypothetical protein